MKALETPIELSSVQVQECVSGTTKTCLLQTGTNGKQTCTNQQWGSCEFDSCQAGFYQSGNLCLPQICTPNEIKTCSVTGGSGTQSCNAEGSQLSACVATQCNTGYTLSNGTCLPNQCTPAQQYSCIYPNGTGTRTCNSDGQTYSACALVSCNAGFYQSGANCVAQVCSPNTQVTCTVANGVGAKTCNALGSALGNCVATSCDANYQLQNGACVLQNICTPNSTRSCLIANGTGSQICSADGSMWGSCNWVSCDAGFTNVNGSCMAQLCGPNSVTSCTVQGGQGIKTCNSNGTAYGTCVATSCSAGYQLVNGSCVANSCTPGTQYPCQANNGSGTKVCNSDGQTYGTCNLSACDAGYYLSSGTCRAQVCSPNSKQSCLIANGQGEKTCNVTGSGYGSCIATTCNSGFSIINNQCLVCAPGAMDSCSIANGAGTRVCTANGLSWGSCTVTTCNSGYIVSGNTCVPKPVCLAGEKQSCAIENGAGEQSCNTFANPDTWGACTAVTCNTGYEITNGQCTLINSTSVGAVSTALDVDRNFYKKQFTVNGLPIIGSANVRDSAFLETKIQLNGMFSANPALFQSVQRGSAGATYLILIGENEGILDIPEYKWLATAYPDTDWNARARGFGGTWGSPYTATAEENILCLQNNRYWDMSVLIHEMGHTVMNVGYHNTTTYTDIVNAYNAAKAAGKWPNAYGITNQDEYFADGALIWFDAYSTFQTSYPKTRTQLLNTSYDTGLSNVLNVIYGKPTWRWSRCPVY